MFKADGTLGKRLLWFLNPALPLSLLMPHGINIKTYQVDQVPALWLRPKCPSGSGPACVSRLSSLLPPLGLLTLPMWTYLSILWTVSSSLPAEPLDTGSGAPSPHLLAALTPITRPASAWTLHFHEAPLAHRSVSSPSSLPHSTLDSDKQCSTLHILARLQLCKGWS